ncbi:MAG: ParB/RepB/Spo0J family partition protein, partial [Candidatus Geothermarchaeales archaeon]
MSRKGGDKDRNITINMPLHLLYLGGCNVRGSDPFRDVEGSELLESIREKGVIQPIVARYTGDKYEVVCGARRYACAKTLGLERVPVTIMSLSDVEALELSLTENVQRQNLTVEDEAKAYVKLIESHGSMREVSRRIGISHAHICQVLVCREAQQKLQHHDIKIGSMLRGSRRGKSFTTLPIRHAVLLEQTFKGLEKSDKLTHEELDHRYVEAAKLIAHLSQREAGELLKRLAQSPEKPLEELMGEIRA